MSCAHTGSARAVHTVGTDKAGGGRSVHSTAPWTPSMCPCEQRPLQSLFLSYLVALHLELVHAVETAVHCRDGARLHIRGGRRQGRPGSVMLGVSLWPDLARSTATSSGPAHSGVQSSQQACGSRPGQASLRRPPPGATVVSHKNNASGTDQLVAREVVLLNHRQAAGHPAGEAAIEVADLGGCASEVAMRG